MKLHLNKRKIILFFLICIAIFQVFIYVNENNKVKTVESRKVIEKQPELDLNDTIKELKKIRNLDIIEITNAESKKIGFNISDNYDELLISLNILKKYKITNYKVNYDGESYDIFAEIS